MKTSSQGMALAVSGTFFYSFLSLATKVAGEHASAWHILAGRGLIGLILVTSLAWLAGIRLWGNTRAMLLTGLANACASGCTTVALSSIPIFEALVLWYLFPAWTMILASRFLDERISPAGVGCMGLALAGAVIILWPAGGTDFVLRWGHLAGLCSSLAAATAFVLVRRHADRHPAAHFFHFCLMALLIACLPLSLHDGPPLGSPTLLAIAAAGLCGCISQVLIFAAVTRASPADVAVITMGEIVLAPLGAYLLFGEQITVRMLCGGLMIILAGLGINILAARRIVRNNV